MNKKLKQKEWRSLDQFIEDNYIEDGELFGNMKPMETEEQAGMEEIATDQKALR